MALQIGRHPRGEVVDISTIDDINLVDGQAYTLQVKSQLVTFWPQADLPDPEDPGFDISRNEFFCFTKEAPEKVWAYAPNSPGVFVLDNG